MPYAPGVQDISGQLLAQGMQARAQGIGSGVTALFQGLQQNQMMTNQALARFQAALASNPNLMSALSGAEDPNQPSPIPLNPEIVKAYSDVKSGKTNVQNTALLAQFADTYNQAQMNQQMQMMRQAQIANLQSETRLRNEELRQAEEAAKFMQSAGATGGMTVPGADILSRLSGGGMANRVSKTSPVIGQAPAMGMPASGAPAGGEMVQPPTGEVRPDDIIGRQDTRPIVPPTLENAQYLARYFNQGRPPTGAQVRETFNELNRQYESAIAGPKLGERDKAYVVLKREFVAKNAREPNEQERADLLRDAANIGTSAYSEGMAMMNKDGSFAGFAAFNKKTGNFELVDQSTGERKPIPAGATPSTATSFTRAILPMNDFMKLQREVTDDELALKRFSSYLNRVGETDQGIDRLANEISGRFKTLFSTGKLTEAQVNQFLAQGQLQALIGASRLNTVGGGVMTEQDAMRVIARLGGDVDAFQNPEVVKRAIADMYAEKYQQYENAVNNYNISIRSFYGNQGYKEAKPLDFDPKMKQTGIERFGEYEDPAAREARLKARAEELRNKQAQPGKK